MSSRTPRKVAVSIDVASFEREASLSSWRISAAALRGIVSKDVGLGTVALLCQRICVADTVYVVSRLLLSVFALPQPQSLLSEVK